jgi:hypothetical protein
VSPKAKDVALARRLWDVSEELTGVRWPSVRHDLGASPVLIRCEYNSNLKGVNYVQDMAYYS